jgi:hypothetical protein
MIMKEKREKYVNGVRIVALANVVEDERLVELVELGHVVRVVERLGADRIRIAVFNFQFL